MLEFYSLEARLSRVIGATFFNEIYRIFFLALITIVFQVNIPVEQSLKFPQYFGKINDLFLRGHEGAGAFFTETQVFLQCMVMV